MKIIKNSDDECGDDNEEWYTICSEKNMLLEKNEKDFYKIIFDIKSKNNGEKENTVLNILKNGQLFELLAALNPDTVETIKEDEKDNIHSIFITFKDLEDEDNKNSFDKILNIHFHLKYKFKKNKCIITNETEQHDENVDVYAANGSKSLLVSYIKLKVNEKNDKLTKFCLIFKINNDRVNTSNFMKLYIGLYFKKIFHRFKQYFE